MIDKKFKIILASKSPRRAKLLKQINLNFSVAAAEIEEKIKKNEKPVQVVKRLSVEKLEAALDGIKEGIVITADTIVVLDNKIIGKPKDEKDAEKILKKLSGNTHFVYTGFSIFNAYNNKKITAYEKTAVTFRKLDMKEIREYIKTGSPMDKAGAYGIQDDFGAVFVKKINGCYYNVVGLPLTKLYNALTGIL
jgi:septum formation protein